jgi:hypothetical protein
MGRVFAAIDRKLGRQVAVKVLGHGATSVGSFLVALGRLKEGREALTAPIS